MSREKVIEITNLSVTINNKTILNDLKMNVFKGEIYVLLGQSGVGKSVLLKTILKLLKADKGNILINNIDIMNISKNEMNEIKKKVGILFQSNALFDSMTVRENILFPVLAHNNKLTEKELNHIVMEKLDYVNLKKVENLMPDQLSGGMKKRVALARVLAQEPEIILYDEPTTGLDPITASTINQLILSMKNKLKVTSVVVTHDTNTALNISNRIGMLYKGKIIYTGSPKRLLNSKNNYIKNFLKGENQKCKIIKLKK